MTLTFKIQIRDIKKPPVWRRIEIPASYTFEEFHQAIQIAFGWENCHLYQFQRYPYDNQWTVMVPDENDDEPVIDSRETVVSDFLKKMKLKKFVYVYDFGDDWIHDITFEKTDDAKVIAHPVCHNAKGACPPEDCGGPFGYESIKELFSTDPDSEEAEEYLEWMALESVDEFDPNEVSLDDINYDLEKVLAGGTNLSYAMPPAKPTAKSNSGRESLDFMKLMDKIVNLAGDLSEGERTHFLNVMSGKTPISGMINEKFYTYKKPDYEKNIPERINWLGPFWNAQFDDDKKELCHFVEDDAKRLKLTPQQKQDEIRGYMNMLFARFDKQHLENRWKLYGPLWVMEREQMTDCLDLVLEALRQDAFFMQAFVEQHEEWASAVIYQLGREQLDTLESFLYEQGIIPNAKPVVLNALVWVLIRHPEKRLRITAILTKFLNHCIDICRKGALTMNLERYAIALATAHVKETLPLLKTMFSELDIPTFFLADGFNSIDMVMNAPTMQYYCKYDSLDQYLNDAEEVEEPREIAEKAYFGLGYNGGGYDGYDYDDEDDYGYDIQGIYNMSEKASRYELYVEQLQPARHAPLTIQLPSNMTLDGLAPLIMAVSGRKEQSEPYEFVSSDGFRFLSDVDEYALDKDFWNMDSTDTNSVRMLVQKKDETALFKIKKGKKKVVETFGLRLVKKGRYSAKAEHRIDLLKAPGLTKEQAQTIRQQLHNFEQENPVEGYEEIS